MKKPLKALIKGARDFVRAIDGGKPKELLIAQEKRAYERQLRAAGHSRTEAVRMVWERYNNRG